MTDLILEYDSLCNISGNIIYLAKYQHSFNFISILSNEISKQLSHSFLKIFVNDSLPDC